MIGITNQRAKRLWQQEFDRQLQVLEKPFSYKTFVLLNKQFREASSFVNQGMTDGMSISHAVDKTEFNLQMLFKEHYKRVGTTFSNKAFKILESSKFVKPSEIKTPLDEFWAEFDRWSKTEAATKIRRIQNTTKKTIASIITVGMKEGESHKDIAKRIQKSAPVINRFRATNISRTETHTAGVRSVDSAVKSTRIEMEKEWVSARDERTRTRDQGSQFEHFKAFPAGPDGERVKQNEKFQGTGEPMDYPGDSKGSAGNIIQCRCVLLYHPVSRERLPKPYEPQEGFLPAQDLEELDEKFKEMKIGYPYFEGYNKKDSLILGNKVAKHFDEVFNKHSELKKSVQEGQQLFDFYFYKGAKLFDNKTYGQYTFQKLKIEVAGSRSTTLESLNVGKGTYNTGTDLFSICRHEYGHHFFDKVIPKIERAEFFAIWKVRGADYFAKKVSKYASTNAQEAFAECFSAFTSPKYKMSMLSKEIEDYFVKVVGVRKAGRIAKPISNIKKPMSIIGNLSNCVLPVKEAFLYEIKERPIGCDDYVRVKDKWFYRGSEITDEEQLQRFKKLRLPPAWSNVIVSKDLNAKVQAIGMDKAGRWQYRYLASHTDKAKKEKFDRVKLFSNRMPLIREFIGREIERKQPEAFLLEIERRTAIRAGSLTDFKAKKKAYGLTTLQNEHVKVMGDKIVFDFIAKEGIPAHYELEDLVIAKWINERKLKTLSGEKLFPDIPAAKLNKYLSKISGGNYTIKDFRTYHGTRIAFEELKKHSGEIFSKTEKKKIIKEVCEKVSGFLRNTPLMAKNAYIDPVVWDVIGGIE